MSCRETQDLFSAWVDGMLSGEARATLEAHLTTCADCRRELERFRRTVELLHAVEPVRAPVGFVDRVVVASRPAPWYRRLVRRLGRPIPVAVPIQAAGLVLVALTAVYLWQRVPAVPPLRHAERSRDSVPLARDAFRTAEPPSVAAEKPAGAASGRDPAAPEGKLQSAPAAPAPAGGPEESETASSIAGRERAFAKGQARRADAVGAGTEAAKPAQVGKMLGGERRVVADVSGRLTVGARAAANRALADLLARVGGAEVVRRAEPGSPATEIVGIVVPRAAYAELITGLREIGQWVPEREPHELPAQVHVTLRITE